MKGLVKECKFMQMKRNYEQTSLLFIPLPVGHLLRNVPRFLISSIEFRISTNFEYAFLFHFFHWRNWNLKKMMLTLLEFMELFPSKVTNWNYSSILHGFIHLLELHVSFYWLQGDISVTLVFYYYRLFLLVVTRNSFYLTSILLKLYSLSCQNIPSKVWGPKHTKWIRK